MNTNKTTANTSSAGRQRALNAPNKLPTLCAVSALAQLKACSDPVLATKALRFFKTAAGQYGAGDVFLGIRVPHLRQLAAQFVGMSLAENQRLLRSRFHEARLLALIILVKTFAAARANPKTQRDIYRHYLANTRWINNWDLVDASAYQIVGVWLQTRSRAPLYRLVRSRNMWERRIAIIATWQLIRAGDLDDTMALAQILLADDEDLIHKAVGWMLREVAKRDRERVTNFLITHYAMLARTTLRYAIEHYPPAQRKRLLAGRA
ncbi:MAG: DNA alkylation repair protein [Burkholderiaceae bacterium]